MTPRERGFLLLTSQLGDPDRKPLTAAQLRTLAARVRTVDAPPEDRDMVPSDLVALGCSRETAERILRLLCDKELLEYYLYRARKAQCQPLTRAGSGYPAAVRRRLGDDSPGCLWAKGDTALLDTPCVALVGSRELDGENRRFAREVGIQAARQGYTLVSGNARGADKAAQEACLAFGGRVICVVADRLEKHSLKTRVLYLSEDSFDADFSAQRALSRNRIIHSLGDMTFVAQSRLGAGGTWQGTQRNLHSRWSSVYCFRDGSEASREFEQMGAALVDTAQLADFSQLPKPNISLFDRG